MKNVQVSIEHSGISLIKSNSSPPSPQPTIPIEINPLDQLTPVNGPISYLVCIFCEEEAQNHQVGKWQQEINMRVVFVLFHKEIGSTKETGIVKYICVLQTFKKNGSLHFLWVFSPLKRLNFNDRIPFHFDM